MRAVSCGLVQADRSADGLDAGRTWAGGRPAGRRSDPCAEAHLDLWSRPGGPGSDLVGDHALPRGSGCAFDDASVRGRRLLRAGSAAMSDLVQLTIDGRDVSVPRGTTIFDAARLNGIPIPTLCHQQHQTPVGV